MNTSWRGNGIGRRQMLRRMGVAAGAAAIPSNALAQLGATPNTASQKHVLVIGGGMAGLTAAYELEKLGHRVTVIEAEASHFGGRVRTARFDDRNYGELGAMRIPAVHNLTRHYVKEMGLSLRPFVHSNPEAYYYARGTKLKIKDESQLNALYSGLRGNERTMSPFDFWDSTVLKRLGRLTEAELEDLSSTVLQTKAVRDLDRYSLEALLIEEGLSPDAIEMLGVAWAYETSLQTALSLLMREEHEEVWVREFDEIVGGMDLLPRTLASRLRTPPITGAPVIRIEQDERTGKVSAIFQKNAEYQRIEGDMMVCTLPLGVMQRIDFAPGLSAAKLRAVRQVTYDSSTKVLAQTRRRFWETDEGIYGGGTYTDLISGITYYPSDNARAKDPRVSQGPGVFLASYTWGMPARRLAALQPNERHRVTFQNLAKIHPQMAGPTMVDKATSWSWDLHPYSCGAFSWPSPGQHQSLYEHLIRPEGRIFFAGEHASLTTTWIQGAIESALRAVQQIMQQFPA
ncbi:MAG: FAD-dependent oxidoreductase [Bryobacterales bacterium]|nr:FAD-dependent oxidoreductase [Bryobacterales bacterium]